MKKRHLKILLYLISSIILIVQFVTLYCIYFSHNLFEKYAPYVFIRPFQESILLLCIGGGFLFYVIYQCFETCNWLKILLIITSGFLSFCLLFMSGQYNKIVPVDSSLLSSKSNNETKRPTEWVIEEDFLIFKLRESTPFHDSTGTPHLYSDIGFVRKYKCNNQNKFNVIRGLWFCCNLRGIEYATFYIFSNPNFREPPSPPLSLE